MKTTSALVNMKMASELEEETRLLETVEEKQGIVVSYSTKYSIHQVLQVTGTFHGF